MKEFFSSVRFKILIGVVIILCTFMLRAAWTGGFSTLTSSLLAVVTAPLQKVSAAISENVGGFVDGLANAGRIQEENELLREEIRQLNEKMVDYDEVKHQNDVYNELWKIRDKYQNIEFEPAQVIGNDSSERFYSFTIDKGTMDGLDLRDSVHTPSGFVGVITEVGLTHAKVSTILDPAVNISVYDTRTRDTGVVSGTVELAADGRCKLSYLPRESGAAKGDLVATSGVSGRYPKDQIVGKIVEVHAESHGNSLYAIIEPTSDIRKVTDVIVVKSFVGQGDSTVDIAQVPDSQSSEGEATGASSEQSASGTTSESSAASSSSQSSSPQSSVSSSSQSSSPQSSANSVPQSSSPRSSVNSSSQSSSPQSSVSSAPQSSAAQSPASSAPQSGAAQSPASSVPQSSAPQSEASTAVPEEVSSRTEEEAVSAPEPEPEPEPVPELEAESTGDTE